MVRADFLDLPARPAKPRTHGMTHMLDKGLPLHAAEGVLRTAGAYIDIWKFGWGTAYLDPDLDLKIALLERHGVVPCLGGTLLEVSWIQHRAKPCLEWAAAAGFRMVEVSRGVAPISLEEKSELIAFATQEFDVVSEVGSKDPFVAVDPRAWSEEVQSDLDAGAWKVVAEGRESGTVGLYDSTGQVKGDLVAAISEVAGPDSILFEAPRKDQQAWFITQLGPNANLANIAHDDLLGLEALRLGLRADTVVL
jgi:phosphosulfolactate synthase